jgi:replicative DNA helicase
MKPGVHLVIRAEQALLGSVLADPGGQGWLLDLVNGSDLVRPYHGQVLGAMKRVRGMGAVPGAVAVREEIRTDPDLPRSVSGDGVLVAELMDATPRPEHGPAYAAMVVRTAIRCRMGLAASRMRQAAGDGDAGIALRMARRARAEAERCRARWNALPEPMRREVPLPPDLRGRAEIAGWLNAASDRLLGRDVEGGAPGQLAGGSARIGEHIVGAMDTSAVRRVQQEQGRPSCPEAEAAGARALRDLIAAPSQVLMVREWLRPGDFARTGHGELYAIVIAMAGAGKPVDPVTVSWEAARCNIVVDAAYLADGDRPFAVTSAREVRRHGVLAQVARVADEIEASAGSPASPAATLLERAVERLERLDDGAVLDHARPGGLSCDHPVPGACRRVPDRDGTREAAS